MKKIFFLTAAVLMLSSNIFAAAFMSPSLNGSTGLISTPTAKTGWEDAVFGVDIGAGWIDEEDNDSQILTFTVQLFNFWEIGGMYDMQDERGDDYMLNTKIRLDSGNSTVAIGGNYQQIDPDDNVEDDIYTVYQLYLAATYSGSFFRMPAETTIVLGKSFWDDNNDGDDVDSDDNIDFSMGFDLDLFPSVFKGYVHWINDFANYSYSAEYNNSALNIWRGIFNTGMRISVLRDKKYKLNIDAIMVDALDANREFCLKAAFGLAI